MPGLNRFRRLLPVLLIAALVPLAVPSFVPDSAPSAQASSTYLCTGYEGCAKAGYPSSGYAARSGQMYWRMYSGHNCTNYAAYRMIQAGMSAERPWSGSGMAYNWGYAMSRITDKVPAVGAIAWWDRGVSGAGSSGHVAYVERVVSPTEIVISEDSWSGDFHWRTIVNDGRGWPTGFIHFVDQAVTNTSPPAVSGTPQVGSTLTATSGAWKPSGAYAYSWLADGVAVPGATAATFTPGPSHVGKAISVRVTARKTGYANGTALTASTVAVAPGLIDVGGAPTLEGEGMVGQVLRVDPASFSPQPTTTGIRWLADGRVIQGANGASLELTPALVGRTIRVTQVARRNGYERATVDSPMSVGPVLAGVIEVATPIAIEGRNRFGSTLSAVRGAFAPADAQATFEWLRDGVVIEGAGAARYQPTPADVGHRLGLRITATKQHYRSLERTFDFGRTTTGSLIRIAKLTPIRGGVKAVVRVVAAGVQPKGLVVMTVGKHVVRGRLENGLVRLRLDGLSTGQRRVQFEYRGTDAVEASRTAKVATVK
ncbi:CHAP domain-containing protein [Nocardioides sp. R-C-SC26]|uniref:CHAP domain-containing protein n=1 Tax=Nocardioides sp. R-C-SC26 TaxID=2870414 RepID=UPI001E4E1E8F|nr:CHAP domain-containing protein [Nocardioides sp. R-C-SC26]